jgi:Tubulin binding cofactor C
VTRTEEEYRDKENVIIENLDGCTVILPFAVKCVYMKKIKSCKIYVGVCSGATFVDFATDSVVCI